jgi:radical S-adenosyl methionine domain-containing protein 2
MQADNKISAVPLSVNYFFSRVCNYRCSYCFHTQTNGYMLSESEMKRGLTLLRDAGMRKLNFAGGEPFLHAYTRLGPLVEFCKIELGLESISIVSNGSRITRDWLQEYGGFVDILAISCDSFTEQTNVDIGRGDGSVVSRAGSLVIPGVHILLRNKGNTVSESERRMCRRRHWAALHILQ